LFVFLDPVLIQWSSRKREEHGSITSKSFCIYIYSCISFNLKQPCSSIPLTFTLSPLGGEDNWREATSGLTTSSHSFYLLRHRAFGPDSFIPARNIAYPWAGTSPHRRFKLQNPVPDHGAP
jgi:hypothetical protein